MVIYRLGEIRVNDCPAVLEPSPGDRTSYVEKYVETRFLGFIRLDPNFDPLYILAPSAVAIGGAYAC